MQCLKAGYVYWYLIKCSGKQSQGQRVCQWKLGSKGFPYLGRPRTHQLCIICLFPGRMGSCSFAPKLSSSGLFVLGVATTPASFYPPVPEIMFVFLMKCHAGEKRSISVMLSAVHAGREER